MTESYTFKDVDVEFFINDNGELFMTIMDGMDEGLLTTRNGKIIQGDIPFPSIELNRKKMEE